MGDLRTDINFGGMAAEANAPFDEIDAYGAPDWIDPESEPGPIPRAQPRPGGKAKSGATRRGNNGNGNLEWRQPAPGASLGLYPEPSMIRSAVDLPVRTHAYYEAARFDPRLKFEGTLSEFVDMCVDQFFHALGANGIGLQWGARPQQRSEVG